MRSKSEDFVFLRNRIWMFFRGEEATVVRSAFDRISGAGDGLHCFGPVLLARAAPVRADKKPIGFWPCAGEGVSRFREQQSRTT